MKKIFDSESNAKMSVDDDGSVRDILHTDERWKSNKQDPLDVAKDYLQNVMGILKISGDSIENIDQQVSFDEPREQNEQYQLSEQKHFFDSTTVSFQQTYLNLPVWGAGLSITVEKTPSTQQGQNKSINDEQRSYSVTHAVNTSQQGIDAKLPPPNVIEQYKNLFHMDTKHGLRNKQKTVIRSRIVGIR